MMSMLKKIVLYAVGSPSVSYTGDKITVNFPAQFGILVDEAVVEFTP